MLYVVLFLILIISLSILVACLNKKRIIDNIDSDIATGNLRRIDIVLNTNKPVNELKTIQLISIDNDKSATIKALRSGNILTAKINSYFKGNDFGNHGLLLSSISKEKGEIILQQTFPR